MFCMLNILLLACFSYVVNFNNIYKTDKIRRCRVSFYIASALITNGTGVLPLLQFIVFFIVLHQVAYLFFFTDVQDFRSFSISLVSLFRGISGGLDVDALTESNRIFGPLYFVSFNVRAQLVNFYYEIYQFQFIINHIVCWVSGGSYHDYDQYDDLRHLYAYYYWVF